MLREAYEAVTSRAARRAVVYGIVLVCASSVLYGVAVLGYIGFYRDYVPPRVQTVPLYLQYGHMSALAALAHPRQPHHPFALADLRGLGLKTDQAYDISLALTLPRSPANQAAGNLMLELELVASDGAAGRASDTDALAMAARRPPPDPRAVLEADARRVVYAAARPALLAYTDPLVAAAARFVFLPYHLLAPAAAPESTRLVVPMAEALLLGGRRHDRPAALYVEVQATGSPTPLQTYAIEAVFAARLRGLRYFMYHHAIASFVVLTAAFWLVEVLFMVGAVAIVRVFVLGEDDDGEDEPGRALPPASSKTEDEHTEGGTVKKDDEITAGQALANIPAVSVNGEDVDHDSQDSQDEADDENEGVDSGAETVPEWDAQGRQATATGSRVAAESVRRRPT